MRKRQQEIKRKVLQRESPMKNRENIMTLERWHTPGVAEDFIDILSSSFLRDKTQADDKQDTHKSAQEPPPSQE